MTTCSCPVYPWPHRPYSTTCSCPVYPFPHRPYSGPCNGSDWCGEPDPNAGYCIWPGNTVCPYHKYDQYDARSEALTAAERNPSMTRRNR